MGRKFNCDKRLACFAIVGCLISTLHISAFYYSHDTPKWFVFDIFSSLYVFYALKNQRQVQLSYLGIGAIVLLGLMVLSACWAPHKSASAEFILRFINALLLSYCLLKQFSKHQLLELFLNTIFWSAFVFCTVFIVERYLLQTRFNVGTFSPIGFMNNAGQVFNIWIPGLVLYCYYSRHQPWRLGLGALTLLIIISILMEAATRGTIIGLTCSELIVFFITLKKNRKQAFIFLTITALLTLGIGLYQFSDSLQNGRLSNKVAALQNKLSSVGTSRLHIYKNTWEMIVDNPRGVGINNFEYFHPKYAYPGSLRASPMVNENTILRTPHNIVMKLYSELGYIGGSIFLGFLAYLFCIALYNAFTGTYIDKWLFVGVCATLIHAMLSAVLLTPGSLFFAMLLFTTVNSRVVEKIQFNFSFPLNKTIRFGFLLFLFPATASMASQYYAYQGRMHFDSQRLEKALQLNPYNDRALFDLSQVRLRREKNLLGSLQAINQFVEINPFHISGLLTKAERHYQLGEWDNAQNTLDRVLDFYPGFKKAKRLQQQIQRKKLAIRRMDEKHEANK